MVGPLVMTSLQIHDFITIFFALLTNKE